MTNTHGTRPDCFIAARGHQQHSGQKLMIWMFPNTRCITLILNRMLSKVSQELTWFKTAFLYSHVPFPQFILDVPLIEDVPLVLLHQEHDDRSVTTTSIPAKRHHSYLTAKSWILGQNSSQLLHQLLKNLVEGPSTGEVADCNQVNWNIMMRIMGHIW